MAFIAITGRSKSIFAIVTNSTGLALCHIIHCKFAYNSFEGEILRVAVLARIGLGMEGMAESGWGSSFDVKGYFLEFEPFVTPFAVTGNIEGHFAVMACAASFAFFHLSHSYRLFFAGYDLAVMAAFARAFCFRNMDGVAESSVSKALEPISNIAWFALVAFITIFFCCYAECFHTGVASAAGFSLFHLRHCEMLSVAEIVDGVMAYFAVVVIFDQMIGVAENDRFSIFEVETNILGFGGDGGSHIKKRKHHGEQGYSSQHTYSSGIFKILQGALLYRLIVLTSILY